MSQREDGLVLMKVGGEEDKGGGVEGAGEGNKGPHRGEEEG
jgi:hypothetical protein